MAFGNAITFAFVGFVGSFVPSFLPSFRAMPRSCVRPSLASVRPSVRPSMVHVYLDCTCELFSLSMFSDHHGHAADAADGVGTWRERKEGWLFRAEDRGGHRPESRLTG